MTTITYKDGRVDITTKNGTHIAFRPIDLKYEDRAALFEATSDISVPRQAGEVGFLRSQPIEERQAALEEALGVSFPCGMGGGAPLEALIERSISAGEIAIISGTVPDGPDAKECGICGCAFYPGSMVREVEVQGHGLVTCCDMCRQEMADDDL